MKKFLYHFPLRVLTIYQPKLHFTSKMGFTRISPVSTLPFMTLVFCYVIVLFFITSQFLASLNVATVNKNLPKGKRSFLPIKMGKADRNKRAKAKQRVADENSQQISPPASPDSKKRRTRSETRPEDLQLLTDAGTKKRKSTSSKSKITQESDQRSQDSNNNALPADNRPIVPNEKDGKEARSSELRQGESMVSDDEENLNSETKNKGKGSGSEAEFDKEVESADGVKLRVDSNEDNFEESESDSSSSAESSSKSTDSEYERRARRKAKLKKRKQIKQKSHHHSRSEEKGGKRRARDRSSSPAAKSKKYKLLQDNPDIWELVDQIVDRRLAEREKGGKSKTKLRPTKGGPKKVSQIKLVTSPSAGSVYVPAIQREGSDVDRSPSLRERADKIILNRQNVADRVTEGIKSIRLQTQFDSDSGQRSRSESSEEGEDQPEKTPAQIAKEQAEQAVIDAERFKANATALPRGELNSTEKYDYNKDGEFLHVICHVEPTMIEKIKAGQYVELEKLLSKILSSQRKSQESKVEIINSEGQSFSLATTAPDREAKITNVKKWERAFRVYAMVYTEANPHRAPELMQYIDNIHSAANTFLWENVAVYDYMFRKLMEKYPNRSWGVTNTHMWTMYLKDHIPAGKVVAYGASGGNKRDWRDMACWRYNKNKCNRSAQECRFEHRCSVCGSFSHIMLGCPKKGGKKSNDKSSDKKKQKNQSSVQASGTED